MAQKIVDLETYFKDKSGKNSIDSFIDKVIELSKYNTMATHVGKFIYPKSEEVSVYNVIDANQLDNMVYTANTKTNLHDYSVNNAGYSTPQAILSMLLANQKTVLDNLIEDTGYIRNEFMKFTDRYEEIREALLLKPAVANRTDGHLRQVYFPIGKDKYHNLTVLPATVLMSECTERINSILYKKLDTNELKELLDHVSMNMMTSTAAGNTGSRLTKSRAASNGFQTLVCLPPSSSAITKTDKAGDIKSDKQVFGD